jgi:hypothetical protein
MATGTKSKNRYRRMVKATNPYEVWMSSDGTWVWLILKKNQADDYKPYASAMCAVTSPATFGSADYGDTYLAEIRAHAHQIEDTPGMRRVLLNIGRNGVEPVELSLAAAEKVVGHKLTITPPIAD